jgi:hypothetical protein
MVNIKDIINRLFYTHVGQIFISALLGLSLALLFRRVCKENCVIYIAPNHQEIEGKVFKLEDTCYSYSTTTVKCNDKSINSYQGSRTPDNQITEQGFFSKLFA